VLGVRAGREVSFADSFSGLPGRALLQQHVDRLLPRHVPKCCCCMAGLCVNMVTWGPYTLL
jgi:hypothetical protein